MKDEEILKRVGAKLKELRVERNMKQKELSERSGLSMFSISQIETGHNTSVLSLVQILKALDRMDMFEPFLKEKEVDPALLDKFLQSQQQLVRKRVTSAKSYFDEPKSYFDGEINNSSDNRMVADDGDLEYRKR
ncbi:MAG: helix-turn-helix domain-containing protein [Paludibacteraceae bacterium]|nr:helix-turn-helix domain-containing protein [Paludibacteraceae bacterium]